MVLKAHLLELCATAGTPILARHLVHEYLQAHILQSLEHVGAMDTLAFHGGTALRFLYDIPRYSEDLDFTLECHPELYDFRAYLQQIKEYLSSEEYTLDFKINDKRIVHKAFVRFRGLLHGLGLSHHPSEVIAVKLEVDTNPPAGAILAHTSLERYVPLNLQHHDRASLFAGKLHAVLQREYVKGRDIFDLWWYLSQQGWPEPNLVQLNHALEQSGWTDELLTPENWRDYVRLRIEQIEWKEDVIKDVQRFMIGADWKESFNKESVLQYLGQ